jgi:hypothetical protein
MAGTTATEARIAAAPKATAQAPVLSVKNPDHPRSRPAEFTEQQQMHAATDEFWKGYLNQPWDAACAQERAWVLGSIKDDPALKIPGFAAKELTLEAILHEQNIAEAIDAMKPHATPGVDGESAEFYQRFKKETIPLLQHLFRTLLEKGKMTETMRTGVLTPKKQGLPQRPSRV